MNFVIKYSGGDTDIVEHWIKKGIIEIHRMDKTFFELDKNSIKFNLINQNDMKEMLESNDIDKIKEILKAAY